MVQMGDSFVYFPATIPAVLTALRLSVGTAVAVLFFAESFATTSGLGYFILVESWGALRYPEMYAGVLLGLLLYWLMFRTSAKGVAGERIWTTTVAKGHEKRERRA
ncbi:MAG: hypothetical protein AB1801_28565, partial [Chloroflexota bacterium]